jgi:hypothetical protein
MDQNKQVITLDWLSIYCVGTIKDIGGFIFLKQPFTTRQFKSVYQIYFKKMEIGTATAEPHSKIINPRAVIVKFSNDILYSRSARYFIEKFLRTTKLYFKSITRADIARDFHRFLNNIRPVDFISDFFSNKYLKNGRGKFQTIGTQKFNHVFDYLKFGSRTSGRVIYCYNKTKELKEVKDKPHIKQFWERNGLNTGADVWRIEFSFKGAANKIVDTISGLIDKISWVDLFKIEKLTQILNAAINQFFSFKINNGTKNKTRMSDMKLFDESDTCIKLAKLPDREDPSKIFKTILRKLSNDYYMNGDYTEEELRTLYFSIINLATRHNLLKFLKDSVQFQPAKISHTI